MDQAVRGKNTVTVYNYSIAILARWKRPRMALPTTDYARKVGDKQEKEEFERRKEKSREVLHLAFLSLKPFGLLLPHYASLDLSWEEGHSVGALIIPTWKEDTESNRS